MRILLGFSLLFVAGATALAQSPSSPAEPAPGRHITATGKTMPPANARDRAPLKASTETEMLKAQKATEERNKAWDTKMRRTMGTICNGC